MQHEKITEEIIGCAYRVHNKIGYGYLESVYEKCMLIELAKKGLPTEPQKKISVCYDNQVVGDFIADIIVEDKVIVELKSIHQIATAHEIQRVNYLTATKKDIGLILNFSEHKLEIKRKVRKLVLDEQDAHP